MLSHMCSSKNREARRGRLLFKIVMSCSKLFKVVQSCPKLFKVVSMCSSLFKNTSHAFVLFDKDEQEAKDVELSGTRTHAELPTSKLILREDRTRISSRAVINHNRLKLAP